MPTAAIVTLVGKSNYGNRLQNFALQEVVKKIGFAKVETIVGLDRIESRAAKAMRRLRVGGPTFAWHSLSSRVKHSRESRPSHPTHALSDARQLAISDFTKSRISEYHCSPSCETTALADNFDCFVAGSDQIWMPGSPEIPAFLTFAHPRQRVAYAASFGVPRVPGHYRKIYRSGIMGMSQVSVREDRGAEIVYELTGTVVPVVLDPTMLLEPATWTELAVEPKDLGGYVATFFLGKPDATELTQIHHHASRIGSLVVDLKHENRFALDKMGPLEFIGAIEHADLLVTDSYHAAVFAATFGVPFLLKRRGAMDSRFDTLLSKSGLSWPVWTTPRELEASIEVDWDLVRDNLARERSASLTYLKNALLGPNTRMRQRT